MSKGTKFTQQSYKVADTFPFEWIKKKWKEGFHITGLATGGGEKTPQWAVVMSRAAGFSDQCIELDFQYPSEGIHRRWDSGGHLHLHPIAFSTCSCRFLDHNEAKGGVIFCQNLHSAGKEVWAKMSEGPASCEAGLRTLP